MKTISINDIDFDIPTSYNELTRYQALRVSILLVENSAENQLKAIHALLNIRVYRWKDRKKNWILKNMPGEWLHTLLADKSILGWIYENAGMIKYPVDRFTYKGLTYYGPKDNILNLTTIEIVTAFMLYSSYHKTKKTEYLDKLTALLYRGYNPLSIFKRWKYAFSGDIRMPLNNFLFEKRFKRFAGLDPGIKTAIFLQFAGEWEKFQDSELARYVFLKMDAEDQKKLKEDPFGWHKIMFAVAETKIIGSLQEVEKINKDTFFLCLSTNIKKCMDMNDRINSGKK
jgi:hypothetical protein